MPLIYSGQMRRKEIADSPDDSPVESWSVSIPIIPTYAGKEPSANAQPQQWVIDTGFDGDAFVWRNHFVEAGIEFDEVKHQTAWVTSTATGRKSEVWMCKVYLWLASSVPPHEPYRLAVPKGVACRRETASDPNRCRALIGMRLLIRSRLRLQCDFGAFTFSLWAPD